MKTDTPILDGGSIETLYDRRDARSFFDPICHATIVRSEANILQWMTYLPEDCIARMIEMKWDVTT